MSSQDPVGSGPRVYADHGSATPVHPAAREALLAAPWADPRGLHSDARLARRLLDDSLAQLAVGLGCRVDELVLTAGLTQALRWGVQGVRAARRRVGSRVVASAIEHSAILGLEAVTVPVDELGHVDPDRWRLELATPGTVLACLQLANQEVGTVQQLPKMWPAAPERPVPLLCDASAAVAHLDVAALARPADLVAVAPALWGGAAGLGVLVVRTGTRWSRPEADDEPAPVSLVAAAAAALTAVTRERDEVAGRLRALTDELRERLSTVPDLVLHGDPKHRLPGLVAVSCLYVDAESLVSHLDRAGISVHSGSACVSDTTVPSHVLLALGALTQGNLRITLGRDSTRTDVERLAIQIPRAVEAVREAAGVVRL